MSPINLNKNFSLNRKYSKILVINNINTTTILCRSLTDNAAGGNYDKTQDNAQFAHFCRSLPCPAVSRVRGSGE